MKYQSILFLAALLLSSVGFTKTTWTCQFDTTINKVTLENKTGIVLNENTPLVLAINNQDLVQLSIGATNIDLSSIAQFDLLDWKQRTVASWINQTTGDMLQVVLSQSEARARLQITDGDLSEDLAIFKNCKSTEN